MHHGLFTVKVWRGYSREVWENRKKREIFTPVHCKCSPCLHP